MIEGGYSNTGSSVWCSVMTRGVGDGGVRWEAGSRGKGYTYTYGWFTTLYGRNQHNIVKQLSSN